MEEHNKKTLIEALSSLPDHEPEDELWDRIQHKLKGQDDLIPKDAIRSLPVHEPPARLWAGIAEQLDAQPAEKGRVVRISWKKAMALAASFALIVFAFFQWKAKPEGEKGYSISYAVENLDPLLAAQDWDEDEDAFVQFLEICEAKKYICEQPAFQQLRSELEELTLAKNSLKEAVGDYGANASLVTQIKEIELERTDLLKKMMVMLI
ncbi:MAG: anti-sigma factor [Lewinellaceae bacterium]|nr:anti-sigma factor [Saprospiraceae bacterium]MCB9340293.1 anti-sigma factor [Lewinellaceae bacterium]